MLRRTSLGCGLLVLLFILTGFAEKKPSSPNVSDLIEFPVTMQQKVAAGITPVGTKVQAKLTISTLVHGTVVPRDAVLSGEVTESERKSADNPSKLSIRMDLAQWKSGSLPIKIYLTEWYYPMKTSMGEEGNPSFPGMHGSVGVSVGGGNSNTYPGNSPDMDPTHTNSPSMDPSHSDPSLFPSGSGPGVTANEVSTHRVRMKDVESKRGEDGAISLTSKKNSLKLDKFTTYVMCAVDLLPQR